MKFLSFLAAAAAASMPLATAFAPMPHSSSLSPSSTTPSSTALSAAAIQFVRGLDETVVPDVKLTRARDGSSGTATFRFKSPNVFDASTAAQGEITGMFLQDEEGEITTTNVNASFTNGKPQSIEAVLLMKSPAEWDRFMRFMERYAEENGLGFNKA